MLRRDREQLEADKRALKLQVEEFEVREHRLRLEIQSVNQQIKLAKEDKKDADAMRGQVDKAREHMSRQEVRA